MARILIAEDDAIAASVLANALMNAGHAVGVLDNGRDALFTIRAKRPDIVILDGDLPEMHGLTVLRDLRHDAQVWHTPVFMLTASRSRADEEIAMRAGATGYLRKPFDPDYVLFRINAALESHLALHAPPPRRTLI